MHNKLDHWFANNKSGHAMSDRLLLMHWQQQNKQSISIANRLAFTVLDPHIHYCTQNFKGCKQLRKRALFQGWTDLRRGRLIFPASYCFRFGYDWHNDSYLMNFEGKTERILSDNGFPFSRGYNLRNISSFHSLVSELRKIILFSASLFHCYTNVSLGPAQGTWLEYSTEMSSHGTREKHVSKCVSVYWWVFNPDRFPHACS